MSDDNTNNNQGTPPPPTEHFEQRPAQREDFSIREGAWHAVVQGAEIYGALGGGTAGFMTAAHLAKGMIGNVGSSQDAPAGSSDSVPSNGGDGQGGPSQQ